MDKITILGTGAMAMFLGGKLAEVGIQVSFLGTWRDCIDAINQRGICVIKGGSPHYFPAQAYSKPDHLLGTQQALVLVKSWQTERAARQLKKILSADGIALSLQNGLGNGEILSQTLGKNRTAVGVTTYGATMLDPGQVRPGGEGTITVGDHSRLDPLINIFQQAGFNLQQVADLSGLIWRKLLINVAINPLTALLEVKNGKLLDSSAVVRLMGNAAREAADVAHELGIQLDITDPEQAATEVAAATAENLSSMLQDIRRGAPTEIEALCGAVVRQGNKLALPTPVNQMLMLLIQGKVDLQRTEG
jgi:2-dehydropantoate 2-reductase